MKTLKILHTVEFYHPSLGGAQEVVKRISEGLVALGHDVTVATSNIEQRSEDQINGVAIKGFQISGNAVKGMVGEIEAYQNFVKHGNFDLVMNYAAQQWTFDALLPVLSDISAKKVLVPCGFSGLFLDSYKSYFDSLPQYLSEYDRLIFLSSKYRDIDFCTSKGLANFDVIANGCAESEFGPVLDSNVEVNLRKKLGIPEDDFLVLLVGSHTGEKGHREAIEIFKRANLKNASLVIVGNIFSRRCHVECTAQSFLSKVQRSLKLTGHKVLNLQLSRQDTISLFKAADLFLFPSQIECSPIVLFEAIASGTPFLSTDVGNSSEIAAWSQAGEIIKTSKTPEGQSVADVEDGASKLRGLYGDKDRREKMGKLGRTAWKERFTWEKIVKEYESLYFRLLDGEKN